MAEMPRFFLSQDDDAHWYLIACEDQDLWETYMNLPYEERVYEDAPECARRIDGPHMLTFTDPAEE